MTVAQKDEIERLRQRIAELEAERDSIRDKALEEAAIKVDWHASQYGDEQYQEILKEAADDVRALKGDKG